MKYSLITLSIVSLMACNGPTKDSNHSSEAAKSNNLRQEASIQKKNPDFSAVVSEVDTDKDGKMTSIEWKAAGLPETSFNGFEKNRGYVTQDDYTNNPAPDGIDINGDGKLTVAEFKAFDKIMVEKMKNTRPATNGSILK
jgi:hypothetical protein